MKSGLKEHRAYNVLVFLALIFLVLLIFIGRAFQLTVLKTSNSVDLSQMSPLIDNGSSITQARRGNIYDQSGQPIAIDTTSYSIFAQIKGNQGEIVSDPDYTAKKLAEILGGDRDKILAQLLQSGPQQVEFGALGRNLDQNKIQSLQAAKLQGIYFKAQADRQYANDEFASHLIGFSDKSDDGQTMVGKLGIEAALDQVLSGHDKQAQDLYLTLDSRLQNQLEVLMSQIYLTYEPKELGAYLVEIPSGKLLSASQRPSFNLNNRQGIENEWRNLMVENAYEPGSTIKILVSALANELGVYQPQETYKSGSIDVYDVTIHDYNVVGWGDITFDEGLARSSNVGMVELVQRIGLDRWAKALTDFGFGRPTQFGLANETEGSIKFDNPVSETMSAFGQGILTSPIQLMQAYSAIANGGHAVKIQYLDHSSGDYQPQFAAKDLGQLFTSKAAEKVLSLMVDTVEKDYGTAQAYKIDGLKIAAKTGTAQIANPEGNGYLTGPTDYYFSVISFFPADQPKYMLYLNMKQPQNPNGKTGAQILAELFKPFVQSILVY